MDVLKFECGFRSVILNLSNCRLESCAINSPTMSSLTSGRADPLTRRTRCQSPDLASVVRFRDRSARAWLRRELLRAGVAHSSFQGARGYVSFDQHGTSKIRLRLIKLDKAGYQHILV
jgi:hypothetical protein